MNPLRWLFGPFFCTHGCLDCIQCTGRCRKTPSREDHMESLGWAFVPTGPNEWEWRKFTPPPEGRSIAAQGDSTWIADLSKYGR